MTISTRKKTGKCAGRVLIESDAELRDILRANLAQVRIEVIQAKNNSEALKKSQTEKPDIVILDVTIPETLEAFEQLKSSPATSHIPVILMGTEKSLSRPTKPEIKADSYITKPFDPKEVVILAQAYLRNKKRSENINQISGLPGEAQFAYEIDCLVQQEKTFAAIYLDIDNLRDFNRIFGYDQGDLAIQMAADVAGEAVQRAGNEDDLVAHLGSDNFIVVTTVRKSRAVCRRILAEFDRRKKSLYSHEDLLKGFVEHENEMGIRQQYPLIGLRAAVVTNEKTAFHHYLQVIEAASEQLEYMSHFPGVTNFYDLREAGMEPAVSGVPVTMSRELRQESRKLQGVLAWLSSLAGEIQSPVVAIDEFLKNLRARLAKCNKAESNLLVQAKDEIDRLKSSVGVLESLAILCPMSNSVPDELSLKKLLGWVVEQVKSQAEQRDISVETGEVNIKEPILMDGRTLAQSLLYLIRSEIETGQPGDRISLAVLEKNEEFLNIDIISTRRIPPRALHQLLPDNKEGSSYNALGNKYFPTKLLVTGLGGKLSFVSEKGQGIIYTIALPRRWQSWMPEVNALLFATDISRKQARAAIRNIHNQVSSLVGRIPEELEESIAELRGRVQELGILCNRSLYLAEDFNSRLESQQDSWLLGEIEHVSTLEAMLTICREYAGSLHSGKYLFDPDSASRVAGNAQIIAGELKLSERERHVLKFASMLKDMGLVLSPNKMVEQKIVASSEEATLLRESFNPIWKTMSMIPFLKSALSQVLYRYEHYDGTGGRFGVSGGQIPLGARIIAVIDTLDSMTYGGATGTKISPANAVEKIAEESGTVFDPEIVSAMLQAWKRKKLTLTADDRQ